MKKIKNLFIALLPAAMMVACKVDPKINTPKPVNNLVEQVPEGWPAPVYRFANNPISEKTFELGRALFYETLLSKDNTVSCGSCHQQFTAFAHADHNLSHGVNDRLGNRNSPGIFNLTWHTSFMHDGGINHIEVQPLAPITNPVEMDEDISNVIAKLQATERYRKLFKESFGTDEVNSQRMFRAMAQFMALMYSNSSKYDLVKKGEAGFTESEARGYELFKINCGTCHTEPLFSDFKFRNNGIRFNPALNDSGRARITNLAEDLYKFKTPSLRNVELTGPYMHDGSLTTLEKCVEHYTLPPKNTTNLDPLLEGYPMQLNAGQRTDIVAFLKTLTDKKFINDQRFADPNFN